eukprot:826740-Pyramimonas_sp.AAC.1
MPLPGLKIDLGGSSRGDDADTEDPASMRGPPGSLLEFAQAKLGMLDEFENLDTTMNDYADSFMVSDDGTLKVTTTSGLRLGR